MITLITGGARSGKTRFALEGVHESDLCTYIATAELLDDEMRERAARHKAERGSRAKSEPDRAKPRIIWRTIEEPLELAARVGELNGIVVVDCLTMWLSNWMLRDEAQLEKQIESLCAAFLTAPCDIRAITNEVGWSIVPENAL